MFLLVIYTSSFAVGITLSKDVLYHTNLPNVKLEQQYQRKVNEVSDFVMDSIGMKKFIEELNKGM